MKVEALLQTSPFNAGLAVKEHARTFVNSGINLCDTEFDVITGMQGASEVFPDGHQLFAETTPRCVANSKQGVCLH